MEGEKCYFSRNVQTTLFYPWNWHLFNTPLILVLVFRPNVPVILGLDQRDERLINTVQAGRLYISSPRSDHSQRMWLTSQFWSWLCALGLQEPWLMHTPWRDCFKVVEVSWQIYTNRSGLGVGFTDVNPHSMIQILSSHNWPFVQYLPGGIVPAGLNKPWLKYYSV